MPRFHRIVTGQCGITLAIFLSFSGALFAQIGSLSPSEVVNAQTGTTYTFVSWDLGKLVTFTNASATSATLPGAGSAGFPAGWLVDIENLGSSAVTLAASSGTIDGSSSVTINQNQGLRVVSDGANWKTQRGMGAGGSGGSVFTGSTATNPSFSATPTFSLADVSVKSPVRIEPGSLSANVTAVTFTNKSAGAKFSIAWTQAASGGPYTVTYGSSVGGTSACPMDPTASAVLTQFFEVGADGTTVNGVGCKTSSNLFLLTEQAAPGTPASSAFTCWGDSTDHSGWECKANGSSSVFKMVLAGADINPVTGQVTASHLTSALPRAQGGTNNTAGTTSQQFFGTAAPGSVSGNLPGDRFSDTTNHNDYWCNATSGTAAPACTSVTAGGWTLANAGGSSTVLHAQVAVSSAEIKALHASPKTIVAAQGAGTYIVFSSASIKFIYNGTQYTGGVSSSGGVIFAVSGNGVSSGLSGANFDGINQTVIIPFSQATGTTYFAGPPTNAALTFLNYDSAEYATGNGTLLVDVWYTVATGY